MKWIARDTKLNREVALKVVPEAFANDVELLARFEREDRCWPLSAIHTSHRLMASRIRTVRAESDASDRDRASH